MNSRIGKGDMSTPKGDMKTLFGDMKTRFGDMSRRDILARARPPSGRDVTLSPVTTGDNKGDISGDSDSHFLDGSDHHRHLATMEHTPCC